ncbi:MAG: two-component system sensor histidine kinase NtrB [Acetobacteraceae bacterium]
MSGVKRIARRTMMAVVRRPPPAAPAPADPAQLLALLPTPVLLLDGADAVCYANQAAEHFLRASAAQLAGQRLAEVLAADSPIFLMIRQVREGASVVVDHALALEGPRLARREVVVQAAPAPEPAGGVLLMLQDGGTARALDRQITARHAARSVAGMAAVLAHEVKNPLSGIRGAAQLLEASVTEADRELAVLIRDEADRIRALVERMEAFGERPVQRGPVNIHRVLEHVRRLAGQGFAAHLRMVELYDPSLPPVLGNRDQLVQVVLNLVKNAAEAITEAADPRTIGEGEITLITAYQHGLRVAGPGAARQNLPLVVAVRDNGPGIAEDLRPHLFEPFVSGRAAGSGLGLALVAKIVADHGGLIEVESRPGRTEFRLHLPIAPEAMAEG